ncbi:hypothetical protein NKH77_40100 [Streptomyces sp. M19]
MDANSTVDQLTFAYDGTAREEPQARVQDPRTRDTTLLPSPTSARCARRWAGGPRRAQAQDAVRHGEEERGAGDRGGAGARRDLGGRDLRLRAAGREPARVRAGARALVGVRGAGSPTTATTT